MGFLYKTQSYQFAKDANLKPTQILALRFWLLIIISIVLLPKHALLQIQLNHMVLFLGIASVTFILPVYFSQKGIIDSGPELNAIICGYTPTLTYLLIVVLVKHQFNISEFILYLFIGFFIGLPSLWKIIKSSRLTPAVSDF